jgi:hypothetical protein
MRHTVALLRDISRGSLIVEKATKDFRDAWHANQTYMCSSGIENVPVDAWMLEQRYSMYASKKFVVVVVVEIALILTALSIGTLRVIQRSKNLSHLG